MEHRQRDALRRIHQADESLRDDGRESEVFTLYYRGAGPCVLHPRWDRSWAVPSNQTVDDLGELGLLRVEPRAPGDKRRTFSLSVRGRELAHTMRAREAGVRPTGTAPNAHEVLRFLVEIAQEAPECFDVPARLLDRAVEQGFITAEGRNAFARRVLNLVTSGYVNGAFSSLDPSLAEETLSRATDVELTVKAFKDAEPFARQGDVNIFGSVINSQVAMGDITSYTTFVQLLDRAHDEIEALDDVDLETKRTALGLLEGLRGRVASASRDMTTEVAGSLVAGVIARLVGLPPG